MKNTSLRLRELREIDCEIISQAFSEQGGDKPVSLYHHYLRLQESNDLEPIIAEIAGEFAGYLAIKWVPDYPGFRQNGIPEIVDFNVLKKFQREGIGTALMNEAEKRIQKVSTVCGIGFGVFKDYGAAQVLYVKRGYVPDGNGIVRNNKSLMLGDEVVIDHGLVLYLVKELDAE